MTLIYNLAYQEIISVHPTRRQIFAGKSDSTFWIIWHWVLYWSFATMHQQVEPHTDPVPSCINQYCLLLTQYHQVPTSTALYWPSTIIYQPVPLHIDPVPPSINQYRPILTQYHHISTSTAFYWPSTTKYQPVPLHTDPVPPSINQYKPILLLLGDYRLLHSLPLVLFLLGNCHC